MLAISLTSTAQNENEKKSSVIENENETIFIYPAKVTVNKGATTTVRITGENDGAEYTYSITQNEDNTKSIYKETDTSWDFTIPFVKKESLSRATQKRGRFIIDPTFGFGLIGATRQSNGVDLSFGNCSFEYMLDRIVGFEYKTTRNSHVGVTFGLDWRNYKMFSNRWVKNGDYTSATNFPDGADIDYSRLRTLSLNLSFMYGYNFNRHVNIQLGPVVSFNTRGIINTRFALEGELVKEKLKEINIAPVTVDFKAELNFGFVGLYFKYSPCNVLNTDFGPEFKPMSAGLQFSF